jgi:photosystem II stability/assembly factor-like uncharacterized protein
MTDRFAIWVSLALCFCYHSILAAGSQPSPWKVIKLQGQVDAPLNRIVFAGDHVGWICAGLNTLLKTVDGGKQWTVLPTNLAVAGTEISGIWFLDQDQGWAAGTIGQKPAIWKTVNGGKTWAVQQLWPRDSEDSLGGMLDIYFADDSYGWAVGFNGPNAMIVTTADGGEHWTLQYGGPEITGQFSRVQFTDRRNGWALSLDAVMQTDDGGVSWRLRRYEPALLNDIQALPTSGAWVAGGWGSVLHSPDGIRWSRSVMSGRLKEEFFGWVRFINDQVGWISGTKCNIAATRDGGKTWAPEACPVVPEPNVDLITGQMARAGSYLYILCSPRYILVRRIDN